MHYWTVKHRANKIYLFTYLEHLLKINLSYTWMFAMGQDGTKHRLE